MAEDPQKLLVVSLWLTLIEISRTVTPTEFSVSVPENVAVGEPIFSLPGNRAGEKAELPCAKIDGDPYDRFNVTGREQDLVFLWESPEVIGTQLKLFLDFLEVEPCSIGSPEVICG
ncbi:Endothelial cell-specific molecule 1 [Branchiostoma belcheri]|nr:Endothelial cell-specific molecule 1 [Branchiostoma belcheri]